jgi:hypothetical protein
LLRGLYEIERLTLGPTVGIIENALDGNDPFIQQKPLHRAIYEGWRDAKTFDNIVANPWLAFALNVGADPITWVPASWTTKFYKIVGGAAKRGIMVTGLQNVPAVSRTLMHGARARDYLGRKFVKDYDVNRLHKALAMGELDDSAGTLRQIAELSNRDMERFLNRFSYDIEVAVQQGVVNEGEKTLISYLIEQPVSPLDLRRAAESGKVGRVPDRALELYGQLSEQAKDTYKLMFQEKLFREEIMALRGFLSREIMTDLEIRSGIHFLPHIYGEWYHNAELQKVRDLLYKAAETGKVDPNILIQIAKDVPHEFRPLAALTIDAIRPGEFKRAVGKLPKGHPVRAMFKDIQADESLLSLHRSMKQYIGRSPRNVRAGWSRRMAENIWNNPGGSAARHIRRLFPDRQIRSGQYIFRGRGRKAAPAGTPRHPAFPQSQDLERVFRSQPRMQYRSVDDFFRKSREALTIRGRHLRDVFHESMPPEMFANWNRPLNTLTRKQLDEMGEADVLMAKKLIDDAINQNLWDPGEYNRTLKRNRLASLEELARDNLVEIETRIDKIMSISGRGLAKAMARQNYADRMMIFTTKNKLFILEDDLTDATKMVAKRGEFRKQFGKEGVDALMPGYETPGQSWVKVNHPAFEGKRVPRAIGNEINKAIKIGENPQKVEGFFRVYKRAQDFWKAWTLSIFPQYHTRNFISNLWNNFLAGIGTDPIHFHRDMGFYRKAMRLQYKFSMAKRLGKELIEEEKKLFDELKEFRVITGGEFVGEIGDMIRKTDFKAFDLVTMNPSRNFFAQTGFATGRYIEDNARIAHYLWARHAKNMSPEDAARSVHKFLFDYKRGLTPFETKYMRNLLMPFYAWTRFNLPLQVEMLIKQPGKFLGVAKFKDAWEQQWGGPDPEEEFLADWMKRAMSIRWRYNRDRGTYEYFMLDTWLPAADINKLLNVTTFRDAFTNLLSPGLKTPVEILWNYNMFKKKPIQEYEKQKVPIELVPGKKVWVTPQVEHVFRLVRLLNDIERFNSATDDVSTPGRVLRFLLGKSFPFDPVDQKLWVIKRLTQEKDSLEHKRNRSINAGEFDQADNLQEAIDYLDEQIEDYQRR